MIVFETLITPKHNKNKNICECLIFYVYYFMLSLLNYMQKGIITKCHSNNVWTKTYKYKQFVSKNCIVETVGHS